MSQFGGLAEVVSCEPEVHVYDIDVELDWLLLGCMFLVLKE